MAQRSAWLKQWGWMLVCGVVTGLLLPPTSVEAARKTKGKTQAGSSETGTGRAGSASGAGTDEQLATPMKTVAPDEVPELPTEVVRQTPVGEDALRLGPFVAPPRPFPFPLLNDEKAREVFVDRAGKLYKERHYSGHVPDWSEGPVDDATPRCKIEPQQLTWLGFQNSADGSRVYVQTEREACGYVYRPDDLHIVIDLPQVTVGNANLKRDILTGAFPTAVDYVRTEEVAGGTRVTVGLREHRTYLSAHLGRYVFVDIAR